MKVDGLSRKILSNKEERIPHGAVQRRQTPIDLTVECPLLTRNRATTQTVIAGIDDQSDGIIE